MNSATPTLGIRQIPKQQSNLHEEQRCTYSVEEHELDRKELVFCHYCWHCCDCTTHCIRDCIRKLSQY